MLDNQQRQRHDVPDGQPYDDATNVRATGLLGITSIDETLETIPVGRITESFSSRLKIRADLGIQFSS
jgi:hypothetical protein